MNKRVFSFDLIRFVALLFVFSIHSMALLDADVSEPVTNVVSTVIHAFQGAGVPLFVMLSGALLLGKQDTIRDFFRKRINRILIPFLVWSVMVFGIYTLIEPNHYGEELIFTPSYLTFVNLLITKGVHGIYWYVYMIIGLYLITPFLQRAVANASSELLSYTCILISLFVVSCSLFPNFQIMKRFDCENLSCIGYFLTGYYMLRCLSEKKHFFQMCLIASILLFALRFIQGMYSVATGFPTIYFFSIALFGTLLKAKEPHKVTSGFITFVSKNSYGMYLSHILFISILLKIGLLYKLPVVVEPFVIVFLVLIAEIIMFWIIDKIKLSKVFGG